MTPHMQVGVEPRPDLGTTGTRVAMLVGPEAARAVAAVHALAEHLGAPVANTWGVKGIYPWDNPHHMGTCGLQRDDFDLLGFAAFDVLVTIGLDPAESPDDRLTLTRRVEVLPEPDAIDTVMTSSAPRPFLPVPNELYSRIASVAQRGYVDDSFPRHPARAVSDLKQSLGPDERVVAQPGLAGLWVARTFPTDRLGSVIVPAYDQPGIAAAVALVSAAQGTPTVCVVHSESGSVDDVTAEVTTLARTLKLPLRWLRWGDDVDWSRTEDLIAAAGPVVAWAR